jgi:hypothetical protein
VNPYRRTEPPAPPGAPELVAHLGVTVLEVEPQEPDRPDHLTVADRHDCPADRVPGRVALLEALERGRGLGQGREGRHVVVPRDLGVPEDVEERRGIPGARGPEAEAPADQLGHRIGPHRGQTLISIRFNQRGRKCREVKV